ncbi:Guanine nucleotide-binding protein subunit gamma [Purpureocillium takamizusanense]|uniref:Guanine nucleotide-binding protein subunit gamma n=1 Tax=Purpureocillium takamizusanense TaxID=2060973 RepID=A0A9Q8VDZ5_9HYPO|nr:Guanine nucleotide-binding protein subunit gamma [Purpureocillium takamizusanense]UNI21287.1 Guanine nucleotide-binding protein subunit gamma [Purpureocillium takamizusanense]
MAECRPAAYLNGTRQKRDVPLSREARAQLQLKRIEKINLRQQEELGRERVPVSVAAMSIVKYCSETKDYMVPSAWGRIPRDEDPYATKQSNGCCTAM